jgi:hypothetical protein
VGRIPTRVERYIGFLLCEHTGLRTLTGCWLLVSEAHLIPINATFPYLKPALFRAAAFPSSVAASLLSHSSTNSPAATARPT